MENIEKYYRVYAEINLNNIYANMVNLKGLVKSETGMVAVIKTDGYGHGAVPIARTIENIVDAFAVATIDEAINLKVNGLVKPVYILGFTHESRYKELIINDIRPAVFKEQMIYDMNEIAASIGKKAIIHIALDTGMSRIGFKDDDSTILLLQKASKLNNIIIEGIFTHFTASDSADKTSANIQLKRYSEFLNKLENAGVKIPIKHCSNSAGIIDMSEANFTETRAGIALYGLYPSNEVNKRSCALRPALELKSHIVLIKEVKKGTGISYGSTYITDSNQIIATIPVGYGDGYQRNLSNKGFVLINGKKAPIRGRVCMDQFMVDVTNIPNVKEGDIVTLIGKDGDNTITVEELAELAGTFNYEFVCDLGKRIPRVYYKDDKVVCTKDYFTDIYEM